MKFNYTYTRLNVADYEASKAFYQNVLDLRVSFEDPQDRYVELATGATKITLFDRQHLRDFVGPDEELTYDSHYAGIVLTFQVDNMDIAMESLKQKGVEFVVSPWNHPDWGFVSTCFRDPDGNLIELEQISEVSIH